MTSYKKVVKELPEFELVIDKENHITMGTTIETCINWRGPAEIVIKEEGENAFNLSVIRMVVRFLTIPLKRKRKLLT